ncbi:DUF1385 domain-containing protein [Bacillus carboniphilus]|uniref:DUF1385 domain-containing protein n=1 Tax=Bacillus carboniphilus TaxID=86663 RepID=A0ABN0VZQ7_9BACI
MESVIRGGRAGVKGITFYSDSFKSRATRKKTGEIATTIKRIEHSKLQKISLVANKIPLVRGLWLFVDILVQAWKIYLALLSLNLFFWVFFTSNRTETTIFETYINEFFYDVKVHFGVILCFLLLYGIFIKVSPLGKYHAAEHMVDNAFEKTGDCELHNVTQASRIHESCGTNFVVFLLIFYFIFFLIVDHYYLVVVLSVMFGYEVYKIDSKWLLPLLKPFYWIGALFQYVLFTSVPKREHIEVAVASYKLLLESEGKH